MTIQGFLEFSLFESFHSVWVNTPSQTSHIWCPEGFKSCCESRDDKNKHTHAHRRLPCQTNLRVRRQSITNEVCNREQSCMSQRCWVQHVQFVVHTVRKKWKEKKLTLALPVNVSSEGNVCRNMTFVILKTLSPGLLQLVEKPCRPNMYWSTAPSAGDYM